MSGSENNERKEEDLQNLPPTPESHPVVYESDVSQSSTNSRRKYQRGGRKKSTTAREPRKSRIGPVPEKSDIPDEDELYDQAERELVQDAPDEPIGGEDENVDDPEEEYYEEEEQEEEHAPAGPPHREPVSPRLAEVQEKVCPNCKAKQKERPQAQTQQKAPSPFETGIKAFNLKRAEGSGGRPFGVRSVPSSSSGKKAAKTGKPQKSSQKRKKSRKAEVESESEGGESVDSFEEQKQKPMSIRLDLNLMVEIFLKAKIKGDVTITFLE